MLTRRGTTIFGAFLLCVGSVGIAQAQTVSKAQEALTEAMAKAKNEDCAGALQMITTVISMRDFAQFDDQLKAYTFDLGLRCAVVQNQNDIIYKYAVEGSKFDDATSFVLRSRLYFEVFTKKNYGSAVGIAERLAAKFPDEFNDIPIAWYDQLNRRLEEAHDDASHRRLLTLLSNPTFVPSDISDNSDRFRAEYAAALSDAGDRAGAVAVIAQIRDLSTRMRLSLDPRVRKLMPADFDARKAAEEDLSHLRDLAVSHPGSSGILLAMSHRLLALGRPEEALATLSFARPGSPQAAAMTDLAQKGNWWWEAMAQAYAALDRYDDAATSLLFGAHSKENGGQNVSQMLDLAHYQMRTGHNADALKTLSDFQARKGGLSDYGRTVFTVSHGCALYQSGDVKGAAADRDFAVAHEKDSPANLIDLLLCMDQIDSAAAVAVRMLEDPDQRVEALLGLSDYEPELHPLKDDPLMRHLPELKARPEIKAATARAGGTRHFTIRQGAM